MTLNAVKSHMFLCTVGGAFYQSSRTSASMCISFVHSVRTYLNFGAYKTPRKR
jgi:hypothetical protein